MSSVQRKCKRVVMTSMTKSGRVFVYQRPVSKIDLKREGKTLIIADDKQMISLDGHGIRMLKRILKDVGEHGSTINKKTAKIRELVPVKA
jgi:hypothetical protein